MKWICLVGWVWLGGCGMPRCQELCERNAECLQEELQAVESSWQDWTGYPDRAAYEEACYAVFDESRGMGGGRKRAQKTCRAELRKDCLGQR